MALIEGLRQLLSTDENWFSDLHVELVDGTYHCHKIILCACSFYCQGLFRSGEESEAQSKLFLKDISVKTFKVIYDFVYFGINGINKENVLDVWRASDFLLMEFITTECKRVVTEHITEENIFSVYTQSKMLDLNVKNKVLRHIAINFDQYKDSHCVMMLDSEDLYCIVRDTLLLTEKEHVVDTILKWVRFEKGSSSPHEAGCSKVEFMTEELEQRSNKYGTEQRREYLAPLMSVSRLVMLKEVYKTQLLMNPMLSMDSRAKHFIWNVAGRKSGSLPNFFPTYLTQRQFSHNEDVIVLLTDTKLIKIFSLPRMKLIKTCDSHILPQNSTMCMHKTDIFSCGMVSSDLMSVFIFQHEQGTWNKLKDMNMKGQHNEMGRSIQEAQQKLIFLSTWHKMFLINTITREVSMLDPLEDSELCHVTQVPDGLPIIYGTSYYRLIICICGDSNNRAEINIYNTFRKEWNSKLYLEGFCGQGIVSFIKDENLFFLNSDGKMYELTMPERITVKQVTSFNLTKNLVGAIAYCEDLFLFTTAPDGGTNFNETIQVPLQIPELFEHVNEIFLDNPCTGLIATTQRKSYEI